MKIALDTNILAYAEGVDDLARKTAASELIASLPADRLVLPAQVIGELFSVLTRKARRPTAAARLACSQWMHGYDVAPTTTEVLKDALDLASSHRISGWDAVVIATAALAGCRYLLTEDMHGGFSWRGITLANPFGAMQLPAPLAAFIKARTPGP